MAEYEIGSWQYLPYLLIDGCREAIRYIVGSNVL